MKKNFLIIISILIVSILATYIVYQLQSVNSNDVFFEKIKKKILQTDSVVVAKIFDDNDILPSDAEKLFDDEPYYIENKIKAKEELDEIINIIINGEIIDIKSNIIYAGFPQIKILFMQGEKIIAILYPPSIYSGNKYSTYHAELSSATVSKLYEKLGVKF